MSRSANRRIGTVSVTLALKGDAIGPEPVENSLGKLSTGPLGLLNLLETQLGIPSTETPFTTRLIQYLACVEQANHPDAFYHASYQADPFSVARTLLQWRDQWYEAGWNGRFEGGVPARLADMAAIEQLAALAVDAGTGQRIQRVIALAPDNPLAIESIILRDTLTDFPQLWQQLLQATGAPVDETGEPVPQADEKSDLGQLQRKLLDSSGKPITLREDGSITVLQADSALDSRNMTAALVQQQLTRTPEDSLAILAGQRGDLLDEALEATGAPRLGFSSLSPWRPIFQVLPLACELLWEPLNPTALFQFLSHPVGPIPARQREALARTVASVPGIGSEAWEQAVTQCLASEDEKTRESFRESIGYWLESHRHDPRTGVDCNTLAARVERIASWLTGAREACKAPAQYSLYGVAMNQASELVKTIQRLRAHGRETLTRDNVLRLIEDVRGTGAPVTDRQAEVSPGQARAFPASHPAAFHCPVDRVIWWDCQATDHVRRWPWSRPERKALRENGLLLQDEDDQLHWLGKAWLRPILSARKQLTLVLHRDGERHHPVWDLIESVSGHLPILPVEEGTTADRLGLGLAELEPRPLPPRARWWQLPRSVNLPNREFESYSSLDAYIHSPYQWLLRYAARIRPGSLGTVNDGALLKGNLAHRLFEQYFNHHLDIQSIDPEQVPDWVDEHIPLLLRQEGALLLEPGRQAECEHLIAVLQGSLATLVVHLQQSGAVKVEMELWQQGGYAGGKLNGSIDLLATTAQGVEAVVDIKWGGRNYRRDSLQIGSYLQLATYAQLRLAAGAKTFPRLSYYIVSDSHMLNLEHTYFPGAEHISPDTEENPAQYWERFQHSWRWRKKQFDKGLIEVTVTGTEPTADSDPGESGLPMPEASDTFNDYRVLTGWETGA